MVCDTTLQQIHILEHREHREHTLCRNPVRSRRSSPLDIFCRVSSCSETVKTCRDIWSFIMLVFYRSNCVIKPTQLHSTGGYFRAPEKDISWHHDISWDDSDLGDLLPKPRRPGQLPDLHRATACNEALGVGFPFHGQPGHCTAAWTWWILGEYLVNTAWNMA